MASSPTISWQIEGGKVEIVKDFLFQNSKITVDGDCSHEIKKKKKKKPDPWKEYYNNARQHIEK